MSKQILPHELAEVVTCLLVAPEHLGELDTTGKHMSFIRDIGEVVANHCGGKINNVWPPELPDHYLSDSYHSPYMSVSPDENLPSFNNNVWSLHDHSGWEGEDPTDLEIENGEIKSKSEIITVRSEIQSLLSQKGLDEGFSQAFKLDKIDWRIPEGAELDSPEDNKTFCFTANLGNQSSFEFCDETGDSVIGFAVEINRGVPSLVFDVNGGDSVLHLVAAHDGLVLLPANRTNKFVKAPLDRFSSNDPNSLLITPSYARPTQSMELHSTVKFKINEAPDPSLKRHISTLFERAISNAISEGDLTPIDDIYGHVVLDFISCDTQAVSNF